MGMAQRNVEKAMHSFLSAVRLKETLEYTPSNGSHLPLLDSIIYPSP
jgi:hypothetical protein